MDSWNWQSEAGKFAYCLLGQFLFGPGLGIRIKRVPTFEDWVRFAQEQNQKDEFDKQAKASQELMMKLKDWQIIHDYVWYERPKELGSPTQS